MSEPRLERDFKVVPERPAMPVDLVALSLVMERRLLLADAVRVLMVREELDRAQAVDLIVRATAFAADRYEGRPLDGQLVEAL